MTFRKTILSNVAYTSSNNDFSLKPMHSSAGSSQSRASRLSRASRAGDSERGREIFVELCSRCHMTDGSYNKKKRGPPFKGFFGKRPATASTKYHYSDTLRQRRMLWNKRNLDNFLKDPKAFILGTGLEAPPIPSSKDRADLISFFEKNFS